MTAEDVKFTYELANPNGAVKVGLTSFGLWSFLESVDKVDDLTVDFKFKANPAYQEVGFYLWQTPIVPIAIWSKLDVKDITGGANDSRSRIRPIHVRKP